MVKLKISENSQLTMTIGSDEIVFDKIVSIEVPDSYEKGQRELEQVTIKLSDIQEGHYMILKDVFNNDEDFTLIYTEEDSYNSINFISPFLHKEPRPSMISKDEGTLDLIIKCAKVDIEFKK